MIPPPKTPKRVKITKATFLGEDPQMDEEFLNYLEYLEIDNRIVESSEEWPMVEYEGSPYDIKNMLDSRFGMSISEIQKEFPQLFD
jgi:hypothetical protein